MRRLSILATAALSLALSGFAVGQSTAVNVSANVSWTAPPVNAAGTNAPTSYNVYASTSPLTATPATPLATVTAPTTSYSTTASVNAVLGSTLYVYVTACNSAGCSALSAPGTKVITLPATLPGVPTNITITLNVTPAS